MATQDFTSSIRSFSDLLNPQNGNDTGYNPLQLFGNNSTTSNFGFPGNDSQGGGIGGLGGLLNNKTLSGVGQGLGILGGAANTFLALKQFGLVKDSLKTSKQQFDQQYNANKTLTNASLRDRQTARVAANPNAQAVEEYMRLNGIV